MQIPQITFLRFIAAMAVVILHYGRFTAPFSLDALAPVFACGALGVPFFFTLSGFLLVWVYGRKPKVDWKRYAVARFARIAPLYYLAFVLALSLLLILRLEAPGTGPSLFHFSLQILGLQAWVPDYSYTVNFPAWSISVEFFLYAMFPLLLLFLKDKSNRFLLVFAFIPWAFGYVQMEFCNAWTNAWLHDPNDYFLLRFPLWHLNAFIVGMCGGLWLLRKPASLKSPSWLPSLLILVSGAFLVAICYFPDPIITHAANGLLSPVYLLVILAFTQDSGPVSKLFAAKPLQLLGEASYAVYLLQFPWFLLIKHFFPEEGVPYLHGIGFAVYLISLVTISCLLHLAFEKPLRSWINGWMSRA